MAETSLPHRRTHQLARTLRFDRAALEVLNALTMQGIPALLLKGASFRQWLYPHEGRLYGDVDILVPQAQWDQAIQTVECLGFAPDRRGPTGGDWYRARDRIWLDLHYTLWGLRQPPAQVWKLLWEEREVMQLHGATVLALNEQARLFHAVLHAIQTGNAKTKAADDLTRAVQVVPFERWEEAWALARGLQAERRFAASLRLYTSGGGEVADRLGVPRRVPFLECVHALERAPASVGLTELLEGNWYQRYTVLKRWVWPEHDLVCDLEQNKIPNVPVWVQRRTSRYLKFYLWRCCQVFFFLRTCPAALRLRRAPDRSGYRSIVSQPWRDDR
jgi:hypothetical protein